MKLEVRFRILRLFVLMRFRSTVLLAAFAWSQLGYDCGGADGSFNDSVASKPVGGESAGPSGGVNYSTPDGAADSNKLVHGSPLCGVQTAQAGIAATCMPDESDAARVAASCESPADAGASMSDAGASGTSTRACRVTLVDGTPKPQCQAAGATPDGARCIAAADCAPGLDCVDLGYGNESVCRKYCCSNQCDGSSFCDFAHPRGATSSLTAVPVCVNARACTLLGTTCASNETCAVVGGDGRTSCVLKGAANTGELCELERCGANDSCVGSMGMRKCVHLCRIDGSDCANGAACKANSLITDTRIGFCL